MNLIYNRWWGYSSEALGSVQYSFIVITPWSTLAVGVESVRLLHQIYMFENHLCQIDIVGVI